jgi:hypothetical protein
LRSVRKNQRCDSHSHRRANRKVGKGIPAGTSTRTCDGISTHGITTLVLRSANHIDNRLASSSIPAEHIGLTV